jgi:hypothetical protein
MGSFDHLAGLYPMCPRGCGRTMDDCYEVEDGAECAGGEVWQEREQLRAEVQRLTGERDRVVHECREWRREAELGRVEIAQLRAALERAQPVLDAAKAWRRWFPAADSMFAPENALIAAVDAYTSTSDSAPTAEIRTRCPLCQSLPIGHEGECEP